MRVAAEVGSPRTAGARLFPHGFASLSFDEEVTLTNETLSATANLRLPPLREPEQKGVYQSSEL